MMAIFAIDLLGFSLGMMSPFARVVAGDTRSGATWTECRKSGIICLILQHDLGSFTQGHYDRHDPPEN
jgi:hypothetical protein